TAVTAASNVSSSAAGASHNINAKARESYDGAGVIAARAKKRIATERRHSASPCPPRIPIKQVQIDCRPASACPGLRRRCWAQQLTSRLISLLLATSWRLPELLNFSKREPVFKSKMGKVLSKNTSQPEEMRNAPSVGGSMMDQRLLVA